MIGLIDIVIKVLCYIGYFVGLCLFIMPLIAPVIRNHIYIRRIRNESVKNSNQKKSRILAHIQILLYTIYGTKSLNSVFFFFVISSGIFILTLTFLTLHSSISIFTLGLSFAAGILPYIILQLKLRTIRIDGSYEAEGLITELINQYKINYYNMIEAIDKTIQYLGDYPHSKNSLGRLSLKIKDFSNVEELDESISEFIYSINTEWVTKLGLNIFVAITEGANVTESMDDILQDLKSLKSTMEKAKRDNSESFLMIRFLALFVLIFTIFCEVFMFKINIDRVIFFQFYTSVGIRLTTAIIIMIIFNFCLLFFFKKPKYDF